MRNTEILKKIWLFSANKRKSSESISKQPTQLIIATHNCHNRLIVYMVHTCDVRIIKIVLGYGSTNLELLIRFYQPIFFQFLKLQGHQRHFSKINFFLRYPLENPTQYTRGMLDRYLNPRVQLQGSYPMTILMVQALCLI